MKKRVTFLTLLMVMLTTVALTGMMATPVFATASTAVHIYGPASPVPTGSSVTLIVTETNNSPSPYPDTVWLSDVWIGLQPGDFVLNQSNIYGGDNGDGILQVGETWEWHVTVTVNENTMFTALGHGYLLGNPEWKVEYGELDANGNIAYPYEKFELWVYTVPGGEGFTPGFWKNHQEAWPPTGYSPSQTFLGVFGVGPNISLLRALNLGGGGEKALDRHAVAALLNAAHPNVDYAYSVADVINMVQNAYATGNFEGVKNLFETNNELEGDINN